MPLADLREYVAHDISLQLEDISSPIDQRKLLRAIRADIGAKNLAEANIANSQLDHTTGKHLCGCPCKYCVALEDTLSPDQKNLTWKVRGIRNWIPLGSVRPDTLLLPGAIPASGLQGMPFAFGGPRSTLKQLERAFKTGVSLDSRIHSGTSVNTAPNLSSRWVGGNRPPPPPTIS